MAEHLSPSAPERDPGSPGVERRRSRNPLKNMMQHLSVESPDEDGNTSPRRESLIRRLSRRSRDSRSPSAHSDVSRGSRSAAGPAVDPALCRACSSWAADVGAAFDDVDEFCAKPVNSAADALEKREHTLMRLVGLDENKWAAACPLCKLFWTTRVHSQGEGDYFLAGFSSRDTNYLMDSTKMPSGHPAKGKDRGVSPAFLGVVKQGPEALGWNVKSEWFKGAGMLFRTRPDPTRTKRKQRTPNPSRDPSPEGAVPWTDKGVWGRELGQSINMSVANGWLDHCKARHCHEGQGRCDRRHITKEMEGFRLIDCTRSPPLTVDASIAESYVALSYVWGRDTTEAVPRVIRDAITVTLDLGIRYLWVDRMCLDESRPREKMAQISRMNEIYEGAEVTIVAVYGEDASYGLPGVGSTSRPQQPKYKFANSDITIVSSLRDPRLEIKESTWYTRGWTYQEGIASRRRLIFTEQQMYWECDGMACPESLVLPLDMYHDSEQQRMYDFMHPGLFNGVSFVDGSWEAWHPLPNKELNTMGIFREADQNIMAYTRRDLTYDDDSLTAFLGITRRLEDTLKLSSLLGIPLWTPSSGRLAPVRTRDLFALSTSFWRHSNPEEVYRRPHLPSWTWAGWKGAVEMSSSIVTIDPTGRFKERRLRNHHYMIATQLARNEGPSLKWTYSPSMVLLRPDASGLYGIDSEVVYNFSPTSSRAPNPPAARYALCVSDPLVLDRVKAQTLPGEKWRWIFNDVCVDVRLSRASRAKTGTDAIREYIMPHGKGEQMTVLWFATVLWAGEEPKEVMAMLLVIEKNERRNTWERVGSMRMGFAEDPREVVKGCGGLEGLLARLPLRKLADPTILIE